MTFSPLELQLIIDSLNTRISHISDFLEALGSDASDTFIGFYIDEQKKLNEIKERIEATQQASFDELFQQLDEFNKSKL